MKKEALRNEGKLLHRFGLAFVLFLILAAGILISISVGAINIPIKSVVNALLAYDGSKEHMVINTIRLPRAILSIIAGAALGGFIVYYISSEGELNPMKLVLAGMAVNLFLSSITQGIILFSDNSKETVIFWLAGSLNGAAWKDIGIGLPWLSIGIIASCLLGKSLSVLALGDDMALGIGQNVQYVRYVASIMIILLSGISVSMAGPIGFVGLMVPHISRRLVGANYEAIIPFSALLGAILLIYSDILSRFIAYPFESPVGIITALLGGLYLLFLARRGGKKA